MPSLAWDKGGEMISEFFKDEIKTTDDALRSLVAELMKLAGKFFCGDSMVM